jgi:hypothetical protein
VTTGTGNLIEFLKITFYFWVKKLVTFRTAPDNDLTGYQTNLKSWIPDVRQDFLLRILRKI